MRGIHVVSVLAVNFLFFINTEAASFSSICKIGDSACIKKVAQDFVPIFAAGVPEWGVEPCDPLHIKRIDASTPSLKLITKDLVITGLKNMVVKSIKFDEAAKTVGIKLQGNVQVEGQYDMKGNLLFLPIEGKGPLHATLRKLGLNIKATIKEQVKDGKTHWVFEFKDSSYDLKEKSDVVFENLFNENESLAAAAKQTIAENGNEIVLEVGPPVIRGVIDNILVRVNEMFLAKPIDELRIKLQNVLILALVSSMIVHAPGKTKMWATSLVVSLFLVNVNAGYFSAKCKLTDSDCLVKSAEEFIPKFTNGIPALGLQPSDPLFIKRIDSSNNLLKLILTDVNITGFKNTIVKRIRFDESKSTMLLKLLITSYLESQYEMSGNLLFLPLQGKGPLHVKLRKLEINLLVNYKEVAGEDGKPHWTFTYKSHTFFLKDRSDVEFENLFNGNELLAKTAKEVIAQSGNEIVQEVGPPVIKATIDAIISRFNDLFKGIPIDETHA
ncbi:uncharacterized protein LOC121733918 [Aricia agestis]|uniref:uncharacterized protein LOC121733918 n=1 Tax=Aricia agestis TaxID=91739 RepID=UPI001C20BDC9|nr:uncharacterized protein LOC121733918 [Aricia agestis]